MNPRLCSNETATERHRLPPIGLALILFAGTSCALQAALPGNATTKPAKFEPSWNSLRQYQCPEWFRDAKFGIYAHWGVYSAVEGGRNTDWYSRNMYKRGHPNNVEHVKKFGPVSEFGYKDLVPLFTAEKFNADEWADLYVEAGAKFAGPVGEHADGLSMWASKVNPWNAAAMGPKRDIVAEMEKAIRKRGLKFMVSMHHQWLWGWYPTWDENIDPADPRYASLYGEKYPATAQQLKRPDGEDGNKYAFPLPSRRFHETWLAKVQEVVTGFSPTCSGLTTAWSCSPRRSAPRWRRSTTTTPRPPVRSRCSPTSAPISRPRLPSDHAWVFKIDR